MYNARSYHEGSLWMRHGGHDVKCSLAIPQGRETKFWATVYPLRARCGEQIGDSDSNGN